MIISIILLFAINMILAAMVWALWMRQKREVKDDPRLSRGLQLLQSKISVLEDLSDRADVQVKQLCHLLDKKYQQVQGKLIESKDHIVKIEQSMVKSREVASIFEDKIPHEEIIDRQNTVKFVKAAQMAHAGISPEEISRQLKLPLSEVNFIAKVNKEELLFDQNSLPDWVKSKLEEESPSSSAAEDSGGFHIHMPTKNPQEVDALKRLGQEFKRASKEFDFTDIESKQGLLKKAKDVSAKIISTAEGILDEKITSVESESPATAAPKADAFTKTHPAPHIPTKTLGIEVIDFPKVDMSKNLG